MTKTELAQRAEISLRMLSSYEQGVTPSPPTIARLASALRVPLKFLHGPELEEPPPNGASYRALSRMTARQRGQAEASATFAMCLSDWLETRFDLPSAVDFPRYRGVKPEAAAEAVRAEWGIGVRPISNMIHLMELHGVRVFSLVEDCAEIDAFSFWRKGATPYVFLNTRKTAEHSRMDAAHELGHLVMHGGHGPQNGRHAETEAKQFASAFLMPQDGILANPPGAHLVSLIEAKKPWRVSLTALIYRLHELKLLTDWEYRSLFVEVGTKGYRKAEPNGIQRETSQLLAKVFASLREAGTSLPDIASELDLTPPEINKSIFGLVPTVHEGDDRRGDEVARPSLRLV